MNGGNFQSDLLKPSQILVLTAILFFLCGGTGLLFATIVEYISGFSMQSIIKSGDTLTLSDRMSIRGLTAINQILTFGTPPLLIAMWFYRGKIGTFLNLRSRIHAEMLPASLVYVFISFPMVAAMLHLNQLVNLPEWALQLESETEHLLKQLIVMDGPWELFASLLVMAVVPGICEEFFFRGVIQKQLTRKWQKPWLAILVTSILFSAIHMQFEGFLPRCFLGALLGTVYFWSSNLWYPILMHTFYNGFQIVATYFLADKITEGAPAGLPQTSTWLIVAGTVIFILVSFYIQRRFSQLNASHAH